MPMVTYQLTQPESTKFFNFSKFFIDLYLQVLLTNPGNLKMHFKNTLKKKKKFIMLQLENQTIAVNILPNISRSKCNRTIKFAQLIEYNMENIFLKKSYTKCGGEIITIPFSNKLKLILSPDQQSKVLYSLFLLYAKLRAIKRY